MQQFEPGDLFEARYRVHEVLGSGGFATVYAATDETNGLPVAIKLLRPDDGMGYDPITRGRFNRELDALRKLSSPHIVRVFDHGKAHDGVIYVVFEQVPGRDLSAILDAEDRLDPPTVEHILRQLLNALREAHDIGVIHRDLKPENVRVFRAKGDPWTVKLLDFGIARPTQQQARVTATGELVGTPRYMSPEQLLAKPLDGRSDLYSLGMLTFEMLMGREALYGTSWGEQVERLRAGHVLVAPDAGDRAARLQVIIRQMTQREAADRPPNAAAVLAVLDGNGDRQTVPIDHPATPLEARSGRRHVSNATLGAIAAAVLGLVVVAGLALLLVPAEQDPPEPVGAAVEIAPALLVTEPSKPRRTPLPDLPAARDQLPPGCGKTIRPGLDTFRWANIGESYELLAYVPEGYDPNTPHAAIAVFHDARLNAKEGAQAVRQELFALADREKILLLFPEGEVMSIFNFRQRRNQRPWRDAATETATDMLRASPDAFCVDVNRMFLLGQGHGGSAAEEVARRGDFAGVAVVGYWPADDRRPPTIPYLLLAPAHDGRSPEGGGEQPEKCGNRRVMSLGERTEGLIQHFDCKHKPVSTEPTDGRCRRWTCDVPLQVCRIDGGRRWPGSPTNPNDAKCSTGGASEFPFGEVIWDFFGSID